MSRTTSCLKTLTLCLLACAGLAAAQQQQQPQQQPPSQQQQQPSQQQQPPSDKPPRLERIEPGSDIPATTIPPKRGTQILEHRNNSGKVTDVEVFSGGIHYHIKPNTQVGTAQPGDAQSSLRGNTQYQLFEFDMNRKRKEAGAAEAAGAAATPAAAEAPPPQPAAKQ